MPDVDDAVAAGEQGVGVGAHVAALDLGLGFSLRGLHLGLHLGGCGCVGLGVFPLGLLLGGHGGLDLGLGLPLRSLETTTLRQAIRAGVDVNSRHHSVQNPSPGSPSDEVESSGNDLERRYLCLYTPHVPVASGCS